MRIVLAPDSFKECLSADEVCGAMEEGILSVAPDAQVTSKPMADGGEGTLAVLTGAIEGIPVDLETRGPLGDKLMASYLYDAEQGVALIEAASTCGLMFLTPEQRNPMLTTTRGVGEMLADALKRGAREVLLTIGGSATADGGTGLARALGYRFLCEHGDDLAEGGGALSDLTYIYPPSGKPWLDCRVRVLCDVQNPLLGLNGAARTFAPQKGADEKMVELLEMGLANLAAHMETDLGTNVRQVPGAGAAGGLGAGLAGFVNAELVPGADLVADMIGLSAAIADADLVITGEGRTDGQTECGKVCAGVARLAQEQKKQCVILSGAVEGDMQALYDLGVSSIQAISPTDIPLEDAIRDAKANLRVAAGRMVRSLSC